MSEFNHIRFNGRTSILPYTGFGLKIPKQKKRTNRSGHGTKMISSFNKAVSDFTDGDSDFEFIYVEFESALNFEIALDKFDDKDGNFRLASCKKETRIENGVENVVYKASVYLNKTAVSAFLVKLELYLTKDTITGNPRYQDIVANLEEIKAATLESFWQDSIEDFPEIGNSVWWEVWLSPVQREILEKNISSLQSAGIVVNPRVLEFPENTVVLIKGSSDQIANTLLYYDNLSELRRPIETADFFTYLESEWQEAFIDDLKARIISTIEDNPISVCLLDTGVNIGNPLLKEHIKEDHLDSIEPSWTNSDAYRHGHGTQMAGIILYGDLSEPMSSNSPVEIFNTIESVKIIGTSENDPDAYGQITLEAIASAEIMNPDNKRIVCLAVTASKNNHLGKPSSWSAAIDQKLFGSIESRNNDTLCVISAGNVDYMKRLKYPLINDDITIEDPAQAFNAITVGSFTNKDRIDSNKYPEARVLARKGAMSPCSVTSVTWTNDWAKKPDVVMEGGNDGIASDTVLDVDSLKLLSTGTGGVGRSWLTAFADTSASTALAANFAAELYKEYPEYLPETIRGLMIHSASWNDELLQGRNLSDLGKEEKRKILSRVGYGTPNFNSAIYSAENSLNIIAERAFTPFKFEENRVKTNECHLFDLPWPTDVLFELAESEVTLKITLSYFIEPNPGNKVYAGSNSYQSHGLRFKMIDKTEDIEMFKARVSKSIREENHDKDNLYSAEGSESGWVLGPQVRDKGSIHKDIWIGSAVDLALRNKLAIVPTGGWWKNRKKLNRYNSTIRYSVIISIESERTDIDLYTPVFNEVMVPIEITN